MSNLYLLNFTTLWRLSWSVMGWLQLNSWWQIFTLISKGELQRILLGMITWLVVQLKLEKEQRHWHTLTVLFEDWRYCTIRNRTPNQGDWEGWEGGGGSYSSWKKRHSCRIPTLDPNGTLFCIYYIPGLKCCISFNCCKHTFFYQ